jgi:glycosyltransferase involved in cell wall biosynthesis
MNIGIYSPSWPPEFSSNGVVTYVGALVPALRNLGHNVFILTPKNDASDDPTVIDLQRYQSPPSLPLRLARKVAPEHFHYGEMEKSLIRAVGDAIKKHGIEILEMEDCYGWSNAISKLRKIPVVVRLHGPWFLNKQFEHRSRERRERKGIRSADLVTSPSRWALDKTRSIYKISSAKSATIPNMLDVASSSQMWRLTCCDRESMLFVGRFDKIKGGDLVIRAFGELAKSNPKLKLTFVGADGLIEDMKLLDYAKSVLPLDVMKRFKYLGALSKTEVSGLRSKHFITLSASRFEIFGYTVLEAMSFGCPTVAPSIGGIPELFVLPNSGRLFEPGNMDALVEACQFFFDNPNTAEQYGRAARKACEIAFSSTKQAIETARHYQQTIKRFHN